MDVKDFQMNCAGGSELQVGKDHFCGSKKPSGLLTFEADLEIKMISKLAQNNRGFYATFSMTKKGSWSDIFAGTLLNEFQVNAAVYPSEYSVVWVIFNKMTNESYTNHCTPNIRSTMSARIQWCLDLDLYVSSPYERWICSDVEWLQPLLGDNSNIRILAARNMIWTTTTASVVAVYHGIFFKRLSSSSSRGWVWTSSRHHEKFRSKLVV